MDPSQAKQANSEAEKGGKNVRNNEICDGFLSSASKSEQGVLFRVLQTCDDIVVCSQQLCVKNERLNGQFRITWFGWLLYATVNRNIHPLFRLSGVLLLKCRQ